MAPLAGKHIFDIVVRRAAHSDWPAVREFISQTYGPVASYKGVDRWRWQFADNPYRPVGEEGFSVWIAIASDGRVAGQIAVQDAAVWLGGRHFPAGWIVDVMVHPDFRGQGLSHRIHAHVMKERALLVTLTMAPATRRIAERAGAITLGPTRQFIRPVRLSVGTIRRFLSYKTRHRARFANLVGLFNATWIGPALVSTGAQSAAALAAAFRSRPRRTLFDVEEITHFPDLLDAFWGDSRDAFQVIFERSTKFLNWRFCDSPGLSYRRFLLRRDRTIRGYLVTRLADEAELPAGIIVDFFARPNDGEALDALLALAHDVLAPDCEYIEAAASTPAYRSALVRASFLGTRTMWPTVVCTNPALQARIAANIQNWHFTKADHDWDQVHPV